MNRRTETIAGAVILGTAALFLVGGWKVFWFITDDAFISFRYVSNSRLGFGYVWNPPPFLPVEGYTNFLWIILLDLCWRVTGVAPPQSANYLSLAFSFLTLAIIFGMGLALDWSRALAPWKYGFAALILGGTLSNRTFLAWSSSGLETAMYNFLLFSWIWNVAFTRRRSAWWILGAVSTSSLLTLCRPDGLLFLIATLGSVALDLRRGRIRPSLGTAAAISPALLVAGHFIWRRAFYGAWLPNTYYAKTTGIWLESGLRYAGSFIIEYGLWLWLLVAIFIGLKTVPALLSSGPEHPRGDEVRPTIRGATLVTLALLAHFLYYTAVVGGDHFEYRVYSHLFPLLLLSFVWFLNRLTASKQLALGGLLFLVLLSLPIPWTHWYATRDLTTREETYQLKARVADRWPGPFRWYARGFDEMQAWLIERFVCMRHQEHKVFSQSQLSTYPSRAEGSALTGEAYPVMVVGNVGVPGWVLPHFYIVDVYGLNDYVIARSPVQDGSTRRMAHDRAAPRAYLKCFEPNVRLVKGGMRVVVLTRPKPLTADVIVECERLWRNDVLAD